MAAHSSTLAWRIPQTEEPGGLPFWGRKESDTTKATEHAHTHTDFRLLSSELWKITFLLSHQVCGKSLQHPPRPNESARSLLVR